MRTFTRFLAIGLAVGIGAVCNFAQAGWMDTLETVAGSDKVSYWGLEEESGATAADGWTTGTFDGTNNGTYSGSGVTVGAAGPRPSDGFLGFSSSNRAVNFAGNTSQLLQMADSASYLGKSSLTMLMFYNIPTGTTGADRIAGGLYDKTVGASGRYAFLFDSRTSAVRGAARVWNGSAEIGNLFDATGFEDRNSTWHFLALTMSDVGLDKEVNIYFDGDLKLSSTIVGGATYGLPPRQTSAATGALTFGNDLGDTNRYHVGSLDEIAFIGRALTGTEVNQLWNAALVPEPLSLVMCVTGGIIGLAVVRSRRQLRN